MKTLLILFLLIPILSWGSEEKARELYVKADVEFKQSGCSIFKFKNKVTKVDLITNEILALIELNDPYALKLGLIDLFQNTINPTFDYFDKCMGPYLVSVQPRYEKIVTNYPNTETAMTIIRNNDFVTKEEAQSLKITYLTTKDQINDLKEILDINEYDNQIDYTLNNCIKVIDQNTKIINRTDYWDTWSYKIIYENSCPVNFSAIPTFTFLDSDEFILHEAFIFEKIVIPANSKRTARGTEELEKEVSNQVSMTSSGLNKSPY